MEEESGKLAQRKWREKNPWRRPYDCAKSRCKPNRPYGKRGIKMLLTLNEVNQLWIRDNASNMITPSIDRLNSNGNYEFSNCRFIEMEVNRKPKRIRQLSKTGVFIAEYKSAAEAARKVGGVFSSICAVACGYKYRNTAYGFKWEWM